MFLVKLRAGGIVGRDDYRGKQQEQGQDAHLSSREPITRNHRRLIQAGILSRNSAPNHPIEHRPVSPMRR